MAKVGWKQAAITIDVEPLDVPGSVTANIGGRSQIVPVSELNQAVAVELAAAFTAAFVAQAKP